MPRRGWIFDEGLSQVLWRQFLRGPCPLEWARHNVSVVDGQPPAPKKGKGKVQAKGAGKGGGKGAGKAEGQTHVQSRGVREPSQESSESVVRLQAALDAMGNADDPEVQSLHEALRKAKGCFSRPREVAVQFLRRFEGTFYVASWSRTCKVRTVLGSCSHWFPCCFCIVQSMWGVLDGMSLQRGPTVLSEGSGQI